MNLTRENRALVADGIERMRHTELQGIVALAAELETINQNRRDIERDLADQAMAMVEETYDGAAPSSWAVRAGTRA